jgi:hypothetical protein
MDTDGLATSSGVTDEPAYTPPVQINGAIFIPIVCVIAGIFVACIIVSYSNSIV